MPFNRPLAALALLGLTALNGNLLMAAESVAVETIALRNHVWLGGTVLPARQVSIAAQLPGRVEYLAGAEGDRFAADSALVALDDDELLAQRRAVMAQIANADVAMRNAGVQFNRELASPQSRGSMGGMGMPGMFDQFFTRNFSDMMGMQDSGMERHADLYSHSSNIQQARNAMLQARSKLEEVDAKLRDTVGYAPFDGVILKKKVEIGDTVQPGQPLLVFADTASLQVQVEVPARLMGGLREGDAVEVRLDLIDKPIVKAYVARIYPMADPQRHTVTVKLELPMDVPAGPGMYAEAMIVDQTTPSRQLPVIPRSALVQRGSLPTVLVVRGDGSTELRVVRTGENLGDGRVTILSGLQGGERLVAEPRPGAVSGRR